MELRKTNNDILENQNNGDYSLKDCDLFKKHYATVLVQLKEASDQACGFRQLYIIFYICFVSISALTTQQHLIDCSHIQVSSALLDLRQRNTYQGNVLFSGLTTPVNSVTHGSLPSSFDNFSLSQDLGSSVAEIVKGSTSKAQTMVDAAIQVQWLSMLLSVCCHLCV